MHIFVYAYILHLMKYFLHRKGVNHHFWQKNKVLKLKYEREIWERRSFPAAEVKKNPRGLSVTYVLNLNNLVDHGEWR